MTTLTKKNRVVLFDDLSEDSEKSDWDNQEEKEACSMSPECPAASPEGGLSQPPQLVSEVATHAAITSNDPYYFSPNLRPMSLTPVRNDPIHRWLSSFTAQRGDSPPKETQEIIDDGPLSECTSSSPVATIRSLSPVRTPSILSVIVSNDQNNDSNNDDHFQPHQDAAVRLPNGNTIDGSRSEELKPSIKKSGQKVYRGCRFQLTLNETERWDDLKAYLKKFKFCYAVAALEEAPETLHEHIHCFIQYKRSVELYVTKVCGAHVERCRADNFRNMEYVIKDGNIIWEEGSRPEKHMGKEIKVEDAMSMNAEDYKKITVNQLPRVVEAKRIMRNLWKKEHPYYQFPKVVWSWGPTGTGKSWDANHVDNIHSLAYENRFFTGFTDFDTFLIDDFRGAIPYNLLLNLTDQYQNMYEFNIKGGHDVWECKEMWITSSMPPEWIYRQQVNKVDSINQLLRRITEIRHYTAPGLFTSEKGSDHVIMPYPIDLNNQTDMNAIN